MNLGKYFGITAIAVSLVTSSAFAHHHDLGTGAALDETAQELNVAVTQSTLNSTVKTAVYAFGMDAKSLSQCVSAALGPVGVNHDHTFPGQCRYALDRVNASLDRVGYYLSDAHEYPQVNQAYQEVCAALSALVF